MNGESVITVLPTVLSATFYVGVLSNLLIRMRTRKPAGVCKTPFVSVLKPIAGLDEDLRENLASFARLDYPAFELLFGFARRDDPAVGAVRAFLAAHSELSARIVWTSSPRSATHNPKVAQLEGLAAAASGDVLVVSDANVRVAPDYLKQLVGELARPGVGLVTSLVVACGGETLGAAIDAAQLVAHIAPAVVAADTIRLRPIAIGKSMAMRRADLEQLGGFSTVAGVLAEDDALAVRFCEQGHRVALSLHAIENRNSTGTVRAAFDRHARWCKMRRSISPGCTALEPLASPAIVALLALLVMRTPLAAAVFTAAFFLQAIGAALAAALLVPRAGAAVSFALTEPLRIGLELSCLAAALTSRNVAWRGHAFRLDAGSKLVPLDATEEPSPSAWPST